MSSEATCDAHGRFRLTHPSNSAKRYERLLKQYSEIAPGETSSSGAAAEDNDGIGSDGADNNAGEPSSAVSSSPAATGKGKARVAPTTPRKRKTSVKAAAASSLSPAGPAAEDEDAEASDSQPMSASKRARGAAAGATKSGRKALPNSPRTPCKTRENAAVASTELGVKNEANEGGNRVQVTEEPQEPVVKQENGDEEATGTPHFHLREICCSHFADLVFYSSSDVSTLIDSWLKSGIIR